MSLDGRIVAITGAGGGLGRAHALAFGGAGARLVLNDLPGAALEETAELARTAGAEVVTAPGDVAEWATGELVLKAALTAFDGLNVLVNNAGITRDRMIFNISEDEWDAVVAVHLKGHAATTRHATAYWRARAKQAGEQVDARIVNTSSEAFLFGSPGQPNYAAAKGGITALTLATAHSCRRYGVRANVICPRARTAMTAETFGPAPADGLDPLAPEHVSRLVCYLAAPEAAGINGQVFVVYGGTIWVMAPPTVAHTVRLGAATDIATTVGGLLDGAPDFTATVG